MYIASPPTQPVMLVYVDDQVAEAAFAAHAALVQREAVEARLARNPHWNAIRKAALQRFEAAFHATGRQEIAS